MNTARVIQPYGIYSRGQIIHPDGGVLDMLLRRGLVEIVRDSGTRSECAAVEPAERAVRRGPKRRRRR